MTRFNTWSQTSAANTKPNSKKYVRERRDVKSCRASQGPKGRVQGRRQKPREPASRTNRGCRRSCRDLGR